MRQRKCRHCEELYQPDHRNRRHQRYCSKPACRAASKAASQKRWLGSPKGRGYFRGDVHRRRVKDWRKAHPGYWRNGRKTPRALQDHCPSQTTLPPEDTPTLDTRALQDVVLTQRLMLTGLIVQLTGSALQENIASATRRLIALGQQVQGPGGGKQDHGGDQTSALPTTSAAGAPQLQLDRPPPGPP